MRKSPFVLHRSTIISFLIILVGFVFLMLPVIPYGWRHDCILGKCGIFFADMYRARDDLWHMSMAQVSFDTIPFRMPIYAGGLLQNYHFLYSVVLGVVAGLGISVTFGYYVVLPTVWFVIYTVLTIQIAKRLTSDRRAIPFFLFFSYFSSGLLFFLSLKNTGSFVHDIGWFSNQPGEYMINPTLALSLIILQLIILVLTSGITLGKKLPVLLLLILLMWGSKFYGGVTAVVFVGIYLVGMLIHKAVSIRSLWSTLVAVAGVSGVAVIMFYNPFASWGKGGIFAFEPFKTMHPMIEDPELLPILRLARLRYELYKNPMLFWPVILFIEQLTVSLYMIFTLGTRILGIGIVFAKEKLPPILLEILGSSMVATFIPILLTQKGGDWFNTIQFLGYTQFLLQTTLALFAFRVYVQYSRNSKMFLIIVLAVTFLGALNPVVEYGRHIPLVARYVPRNIFQPSVYVSDQELEALAYLSRLEEGVVFTLPFTFMQDTALVRQLWKTNDTAYVAALGNKQLYIANTQQLDLMGIEHTKRTNELKHLNTLNIIGLPARYFYLQKEHPSYASFMKRLKPYATMLFENRQVGVWEKK